MAEVQQFHFQLSKPRQLGNVGMNSQNSAIIKARYIKFGQQLTICQTQLNICANICQ